MATGKLEEKIASLVAVRVVVSPELLMDFSDSDEGSKNGFEEEVVGDELLMEASQKYEQSVVSAEVGDEILMEASQKYEESAGGSRFGKPVTSDCLDQLRDAGVPIKTKQATSWAVNVWGAWAQERIKSGFVEECEKEHVLLVDCVKMNVEDFEFLVVSFYCGGKEREWISLSSRVCVQFVLWIAKGISIKG